MSDSDSPLTGPDRLGKLAPKFDLVERTARFGEDVVRFARSIRVDVVTSPLIRQLVCSGASIGANYCEADEAGTRKEFRYRISICKRESRETRHWLRLLAVASPGTVEECRRLWQEAKELNLIFAAIHRKRREGDT